MSERSKACCTVPPVVSSGYQAKGKYVELDGAKTYVTGPDNADTAIFLITDIFGFFDQTLQGADILATSDHEKKYQVFVPDFFHGNPVPIEWYPPDNEEKQKKLNKWFESAAPPDHVGRLIPFTQAFEKYNPNIKTWGLIGYCWGGKMTSLITGQTTKFKAAVQTSPAFVDPEDGAKVKVPMAMLASKEEPADAVHKFKESLTVPNHVEIFDTQIHGFMSARADLSKDDVKKEYERGYQVSLGWFHDHL